MNTYISELIRLGYPPHEATQIYRSFMKEFSVKELKEFIRSVKECG